MVFFCSSILLTSVVIILIDQLIMVMHSFFVSYPYMFLAISLSSHSFCLSLVSSFFLLFSFSSLSHCLSHPLFLAHFLSLSLSLSINLNLSLCILIFFLCLPILRALSLTNFISSIFQWRYSCTL